MNSFNGIYNYITDLIFNLTTRSVTISPTMSFYIGKCVIFSGKELIPNDCYGYRDYYIMETEDETKEKLITYLKEKNIICSDVKIVQENAEEGTRTCKCNCECILNSDDKKHLDKHGFVDIYIPYLTSFGWDNLNPYRQLEFSIYSTNIDV